MGEHQDRGAAASLGTTQTSPPGFGVPLGRIGGIAIRAQWSVVVIGALVAWSLATGWLDTDRDIQASAAWIGGVCGAVLFLASLLAHELSHSLVARRHGVVVRSITLWLLGGVALMERDAPNARAALQIAIAGPLASFAIAAGAGGVAWGLDAADPVSAVFVVAAAVAEWLAILNAALGAFNLLPGAPLDGGRVLRAWFWSRTGDRLGSQVRAARAGRTLARILIAFGVVEFAFGAGLSGLWIAFIGWFVHGSATREETDAQLQSALGTASIADLMTVDPITVEPDLTITAFVERYLLRHRSAYPVVDDGRLVGMISLPDVRSVDPTTRDTTRVCDVMTPRSRCAVAAPSLPATDWLQDPRSIGRLVVVDDAERVVGIVTPTDLVRVAQFAVATGATREVPSPRR
jgi:Zn-dependent protease/CBS domain-containing protein